MSVPNHSTIDDQFGERLAEARRSRNLTQESLVAGMKERGYSLHLSAIGKIERGERRVTVGEAAALASSVGVTLDSLTGGSSYLVTRYVLLDEARRNFQAASQRYTDALFEVAQAGDQAESDWLRPEDRQWLTEEIPTQTPARLVEAHHQMFARTSRYAPKPGGFVEALKAATERDAAALQDSDD